MGTAIITVTQGDFQYIEEWIEYHHNIGVELFCIAYNGDATNKHKLPQYEYVRYFDISNNKNLSIFTEFDSTISKRGWQQMWIDASNMMLYYVHTFFKDYIKYVAVIDTDEFISPVCSFNNITEYLESIYNDSQITEYIYMQLYNGDNNIYYEDKPVLERFRKAVNTDCPISDLPSFKKSIINIHNNNIGSLVMTSFHDTSWSDNTKNLPFDKIVLKHFFCKSLEEWIMKMNVDNDRDYCKRFKGCMFSGYGSYYFGFLENNPTEEAIKAIPELLKKHNIDYKPEIEENGKEFKKLYININKKASQ